MNEQALRAKLPIGQNEKILLSVKHHWFAYLAITLGAGFICALLFGTLVVIMFEQDSLGISASAMSGLTALGFTLIGFIALVSLVPVWLKQQELLILTEESLMQYNKPTLFTSKVSQLNLQHVADVTVKQDAIGSILGYGHIAIETPGEQDNYGFNVLAQPNVVAKAIVEAHENYAAALESGQIHTTLGTRPPVPGNAWRSEPPVPGAQPAQPQYPQYPQPPVSQPIPTDGTQNIPQPTQQPTDHSQLPPPQQD